MTAETPEYAQEGTESDGVIKSMKAVGEITNPEITLTIKFSQISEKRVHQMMMLEVHNPFKLKLTYQAKMFLLSNKQWVNTDVYPVMPGLSGFESWSDIIISLGLGNWKFAGN